MKNLLRSIVTTIALTTGSGLAAEADTQVVLFETSHGNIVVETYSAKAPITVAHFLNLVNSNFYDATIFHRVVKDFVIQAGGFDSNMRYKTEVSTVKNESDNGLRNLARTLSMARTSDPDSASSHFFINLGDNPHLDYQPDQWGYTVFARVIGGWQTVENIAAIPANRREQPEEQITITKASVVDRADVAALLD